MDATPFGHYQLQKLIGRGGMGEVYQAYDADTDRIVALKVLPPHLAQDATFQERFRRESHAAAGVSNPHVVPIHGYGEIDGRLYLDMRLIEGRNLGAMLTKTGKPLDPAFVVGMIEQVAEALDGAHQAGLTHRDVKPSNILIADNDFVYLIDFGLARTAGDSGMTTAGSTLGTLAYMAPERFDAGKVDPRSDIYALACVLYECLTGERPYPADSLEQQIAGHMVSPAPRASEKDPRLAAFDEVIAKGMAKKPSKRYQSAGDLAAAARAALAAFSMPVRTTGRSGRHSARRVPARVRVSKKVAVIVGATVLVAALCAVGVWQLRAGGSGRVANLADSAGSGPVQAVTGAVDKIAQTVPSEIRDSGRLVIGVTVPYAPNEFKNSGGEIVGFDVDLMKAVTRTMGLVPDFRETGFEGILPSVRDGNFNVGMSSITDTADREEQADFVTYFQAGTLWARRTGSSADPGSACGLRVGVAHSTIQQTQEIPAKSDACVAAGLPPIQEVVRMHQDEVTAALIAGEIDAMTADSPVAGFAIKLSGGALEPAGEVFDSALYGWPVAKGSGLAESLRLALEHVMDSGEYRTVATMWGVEKGMITQPVINGAFH
ncbi:MULTISPECIES: bifunctional serine/threonine-protein kinase/transporter substrate-binding domain-containing protein [unclassified Mycolicibacterium]|uniref:bifunctional serine/threonine-protein kinase/transporter substrate-binding domain-containing protein n=1 Tax=unclassified Mycolicibacterium TaxID=2636767 RepID=UPI00130691DA|nr:MULTISPECIES: bifunctional serine/threonine-protein kinase/transporter substrate-binding domain-containing protein [unclassified Mycolicibacterium]MUL81578.1 transporter substrate-binding domain-containing protein [Mycolicibacterium sp. CBMA 329]MUL87344.1 transporter substrate-binding domain-containing protein [Mycolicibacterium sp. CBMA 331]MUM02631.1 transporter substrate-binding domain-containing protein [Mycolicibacterium sp. CBMA 334]MUM28474.1 transporter substrate-binding domain-cont